MDIRRMWILALSGCIAIQYCNYRPIPRLPNIVIHLGQRKVVSDTRRQRDCMSCIRSYDRYQPVNSNTRTQHTCTHILLTLPYMYSVLYVQRKILQSSDAHSADRFSIERHDGNSIVCTKARLRSFLIKLWLWFAASSAGHVILSCDFIWSVSMLRCSLMLVNSTDLYSIISLEWIEWCWNG